MRVKDKKGARVGTANWRGASSGDTRKEPYQLSLNPNSHWLPFCPNSPSLGAGLGYNSCPFTSLPGPAPWSGLYL